MLRIVRTNQTASLKRRTYPPGAILMAPTQGAASPLNVYKDGTTVRTRVSSVSFFKRASGIADLAQVRYVKAKRAAGSANEQTTHWIATIQYVYADPSSDPKVRGWNPLGFKVIDFRPEPEVTPESQPSAASTSSPAATSTDPRS